MIGKLQITIIVLIIPIGVLFWYTQTHDISVKGIFFSAPKMVRIGNSGIGVKVVETEKERKQGLSNLSSVSDLGSGIQAMLFVFPSVDRHGIWMKDMKFSIDIVWIGEDMKVVDIDENISPETYPKVFRPEVPAKYVLETKALLIDSFGIKVGDIVEFP